MTAFLGKKQPDCEDKPIEYLLQVLKRMCVNLEISFRLSVFDCSTAFPDWVSRISLKSIDFGRFTSSFTFTESSFVLAIGIGSNKVRFANFRLYETILIFEALLKG